MKHPIQPSLGIFNETALQRYDFVLDALSRVRPLTCPSCGVSVSGRFCYCFGVFLQPLVMLDDALLMRVRRPA